VPAHRLVGDGQRAGAARAHRHAHLQPGDLFVALKGERFDANDFLAQAKAPRARWRRSRTTAWLPAGLPGIEVPDTSLALGGWRRLAPQFTCR
jgi:UDP-N-acetylmuramoyl-tripeptide--D-alanyl-D-alanine ligase